MYINLKWIDMETRFDRGWETRRVRKHCNGHVRCYGMYVLGLRIQVNRHWITYDEYAITLERLATMQEAYEEEQAHDQTMHQEWLANCMGDDDLSDLDDYTPVFRDL